MSTRTVATDASRWRTRIARLAAAASVALLVLLGTATDAVAQPRWYQRLAFRGEVGAAFMLPSFQRDTLHDTFGVQGTGRVAFSIIDLLAIQASFGTWYFPQDLGGGQSYPLTLGARFEPRLGTVGRLFVDANSAPRSCRTARASGSTSASASSSASAVTSDSDRSFATATSCRWRATSRATRRCCRPASR